MDSSTFPDISVTEKVVDPFHIKSSKLYLDLEFETHSTARFIKLSTDKLFEMGNVVVKTNIITPHL